MSDASPAPLPPAPIKPGYKTTEFWLTLATVLFGLLTESGAIPDSSIVGQGIGIIAAALAGIGYTWNRGAVKKAAGGA